MKNFKKVKQVILVTFDNNRHEAFDRQQLKEIVEQEMSCLYNQEDIREALIELVNKDRLQPALLRNTMVYVSLDHHSTLMFYKGIKIDMSRSEECHHE